MADLILASRCREGTWDVERSALLHQVCADAEDCREPVPAPSPTYHRDGIARSLIDSSSPQRHCRDQGWSPQATTASPPIHQWGHRIAIAISVIALAVAALVCVALQPVSPTNPDAREFNIKTEVSTPSLAPVREYYMYRAMAPGTLGEYPLGNVNMANVDGVIWYLMNEVVTKYTDGTRCPRKFSISQIHRFKVRTRAPASLFEQGMNYGTRFSYDQGMCRGRCFSGNMCSCEPDCTFHYGKHGYFVGCNNFEDKYPFPDTNTSAKSGIWYSLPLDGRCQNPSGEKDCTWSYEYAGVINVTSLEATTPGDDNCCEDTCSDFWVDLWDEEATYQRVRKTLDLFGNNYPTMPRDLEAPPCDFQWWKWYTPDPWEKMDPWKRDEELGLIKEDHEGPANDNK